MPFVNSLFATLLIASCMAHDSPSPPPSNDTQVSVTMALIGYILIGVIVYASIVVFTYPVIRLRFGWPLLLIFLLIFVPPFFFFLLFYMLFLRLFFWTAFMPPVEEPPTRIVVVEAAPATVLSQRERRTNRA